MHFKPVHLQTFHETYHRDIATANPSTSPVQNIQQEYIFPREKPQLICLKNDMKITHIFVNTFIHSRPYPYDLSIIFRNNIPLHVSWK